MLRPTLSLFLLAGLTAPAVSQSGTVRYDQAVKLEFNLPPNSPMAGRLPRSNVRPMLLTFTPEMVLFAAAPRDAAADAQRMEMMRDREVVVMRGSGGGGPPMAIAEGGAVWAFGAGPGFGGGNRQDLLSGAWTNLEDGSFLEVREFLGRTFRIPVERPGFAWKLTGEQATFLGYTVFQAVAQQDSTSLEAWFTPDIPVPAGPAQYGGLPGLILTLTVDSSRVTYTATAIDTTADVGKLKAPTEGSQVTRAEYDKIVEEKTAEMARMRRGRGN
ncbi:MAG TPA: GLPGLI family protein [Gemmatimonadales bacterium]|nr:GLPGLI family protein [Gemmatimonadales bacterium]